MCVHAMPAAGHQLCCSVKPCGWLVAWVYQLATMGHLPSSATTWLLGCVLHRRLVLSVSPVVVTAARPSSQASDVLQLHQTACFPSLRHHQEGPGALLALFSCSVVFACWCCSAQGVWPRCKFVVWLCGFSRSSVGLCCLQVPAVHA